VDRQRAIIETGRALKASGLDFEAIACCGLSGSLVAPDVARKLDKKLVIVRKNEGSHGHDVELSFNEDIGNYVIVDDLVESGKTINLIRKRLHWYEGTCVGVYLYNQSPVAPFVEQFKDKNENLWIRTRLNTF
jgi:adenine/guanine phosphoribosyltransferase-like PRPP-binding protein